MDKCVYFFSLRPIRGYGNEHHESVGNTILQGFWVRLQQEGWKKKKKAEEGKKPSNNFFPNVIYTAL